MTTRRFHLTDPMLAQYTANRTSTPEFATDSSARLDDEHAHNPVGRSPLPDTDAPIHVVPSDDGWLLRFEGIETAAAVYPTKREAMVAARELGSARGCAVIEHGVDGRIR
ncbi:MAG: DUF2188 domain-containing protein [Myxococcota bacterium]